MEVVSSSNELWKLSGSNELWKQFVVVKSFGSR